MSDDVTRPSDPDFELAYQALRHLAQQHRDGETVAGDVYAAAYLRVGDWIKAESNRPPSAGQRPPVSRVEVIDHRSKTATQGRAFGAYPCRVELSYQDGGRTLKVFVDDDPDLQRPVRPSETPEARAVEAEVCTGVEGCNCQKHNLSSHVDGLVLGAPMRGAMPLRRMPDCDCEGCTDSSLCQCCEERSHLANKRAASRRHADDSKESK